MSTWTDDEVGELETMMHAGSTNADIAEALGRSVSAVASMRFKVRHGLVSLDYNRPWSDDEIDIVRRTPHLTAKQVADSLHFRSPTSVSKIRRVLTRTEGIDFSSVDKDPFAVGTRRLLAKSCLGCGLLLDASWYLKVENGDKRNKQRYWMARCTRCRSSAAVERVRKWHKKETAHHKQANARARKRLYDFTRERATRHYFSWVEADHVVLRNSDLTAFEKAIELGRTISSVHAAVKAHGYTSRVGKGDPMKRRMGHRQSAGGRSMNVAHDYEIPAARQ
jgi:hypothetical protein